MRDHELSEIVEFLGSRIVVRVILVFLDGIDSLFECSATPEERRIIVVVVAAHTASFLDHLLVSEVTHLKLLRHDQATVNGRRTLRDGISKKLNVLKLCHRLIIV